MQSEHGRYSVVDFLTGPADSAEDARLAGLSLAGVSELPDPGVVRCELSRLQADTGAVALLYRLVRDPIPSRCCIGVSAGQVTRLPPALRIGNREPLGTDAPGLVILAHLGGAFPINARIRRIRSAGHAVTASRAPGWELLSAPILCHNGAVGAVGLSASSSVLGESMPEFIEATRSAADRIGRSFASPANNPTKHACNGCHRSAV